MNRTVMAGQRKADLEQTIALQTETIKLQQQRINELQTQLMQQIEESPIYKQAISDARISQEIAMMYKSMYQNVCQ